MTKALTAVSLLAFLVAGLLVPAAAAAPTPRYRVLVFTRAEVERHASTTAGVEAVRQLGRRTQFRSRRVVEPEQPVHRVLAPAVPGRGLPQHHRQRARPGPGGRVRGATSTAGGGYVGVHAAAETEPDWPFYSDLLGTTAAGARPGRARHRRRRRPRAPVDREVLPER